jgi:hypothetical protein
MNSPAAPHRAGIVLLTRYNMTEWVASGILKHAVGLEEFGCRPAARLRCVNGQFPAAADTQDRWLSVQRLTPPPRAAVIRPLAGVLAGGLICS